MKRSQRDVRSFVLSFSTTLPPPSLRHTRHPSPTHHHPSRLDPLSRISQPRTRPTARSGRRRRRRVETASWPMADDGSSSRRDANCSVSPSTRMSYCSGSVRLERSYMSGGSVATAAAAAERVKSNLRAETRRDETRRRTRKPLMLMLMPMLMPMLKLKLKLNVYS